MTRKPYYVPIEDVKDQLDPKKVEMLAMLLQKPWFLYGVSFSKEDAQEIAEQLVWFDMHQSDDPEIKSFSHTPLSGSARYDFDYKRNPALGFDIVKLGAHF